MASPEDGNGTAQALVVSELGGPFEVKEVRLGEMRPDEVVVKMIATGICHTDIASATGQRPPKPPAVLGHEGSGVVERVGSAVTSVKPGDRVILSFNACYNCAPCRRNTPSYCRNAFHLSFGGARLDDGSSPMSLAATGERVAAAYFGQSSFAQRSVVRACCCVRVDEAAPLDVLCCLACGVQTGAGTVINVLKPRIGASIAVAGVGSVGLAGIMAARNMTPATKIIAIDIVPERLELAKELGATHVVNAKEKDTVAELMAITNGEGVDCSMDAAGSIKILEDLLASAANNGIVATVGGTPPGEFVRIDASKWLNRNVTYIGSCQGSVIPQTFIPAMIDWWRAGRFPVEKLVKPYDWKEINTAVHDMHEGKTIKPVLIWQ